MISAFGVEHEFSKFAVKRPKGKLRKIKTETAIATHRVVNAGAGPTPTRVVMQSITPLRALVGHH